MLIGDEDEMKWKYAAYRLTKTAVIVRLRKKNEILRQVIR
jgi:hypothetical protein